jgi:hypothetical protein
MGPRHTRILTKLIVKKVITDRMISNMMAIVALKPNLAQVEGFNIFKIANPIFFRPPKMDILG